MNFKHPTILVRKLRSVLFTLFNRMENNNNADFHTNGEERFLYDMFSSLQGEVVLFDIGANIGAYSEILVEQCKQRSLKYSLHIFEPTRSCFEALKNKFAADPAIILNNAGVSKAKGKSTIFYDAEQSGFASLYQRDLAADKIALNKSETISLIRLDEYITQNKISAIDFMKIDIEGHELFAFEGLGKYLNADFVKAIQFEYGGANLDSHTTLKSLYAMLEKSGFVVGKIMQHGIEIRPYTLSMENYQYANYVAFSKIHFSELR